AFNLLPRFGMQAASNLDSTERRIVQHFRAIMRAAAHVPAQQPVRHAFGAAKHAGEDTLIDQAGVAGNTAESAPAITLLQAPTFHAHAFSIYLEWEREISGGDLAKALAGEHVSVVDVSEEAQSNVSAAGQNEVQVGWKRDLNHPNGM